jgi:tetratricopeptide (TPR) repeat protein
MNRAAGEFQKKFPKAVFFTGLILAFALCVTLIFISLGPERYLLTGSGGPEQDVFHRRLREYDAFLAASAGSAEADTLNRLLDRLEKNTQGVETHLSVLKRRRNLALEDPRFLGPYRDAAVRAAAAFPYSEPLAAVAAEALLHNTPVTEAGAEKLRWYASLIAEPRLAPLVLGIHVLTGDLESPGSIAAPRLENLLAAGLPLIRDSFPGDEWQRLIADLALLKLLRGDVSGAAAQVQTIAAVAQSPLPLHFIAEFYYDFGDPLRAAEIFSRFSDERSMIRSADALWLGNRGASARNIWKILAAGDGEIRLRSLYNLAASAADQTEEAAWLERLFAEGRDNPSLQADPCFHAGIIRYTRLLDTSRALAILEAAESRQVPLLDLELLRRRSEIWPMERTIAETWLLLGRHPAEAALYQWGAYYFDHQQKYDETAILIKTASYHRIGGPWLDLNAALRQIQANNLDGAEEYLRRIPAGAGIWQASANLARVLEARRATAAALEHYETAAALVKGNESAALVQFRIARCLQTLGRVAESRRVLEYALDLNPDNLNVRMELRRLESQKN